MTTWRAVTFDCWQTLLTDTDMSGAERRRVEAIVRLSEGALDDERARDLMRRAWQEYLVQWRSGVQYGSVGMARFCCTELGLGDEASSTLCAAFEDAAMDGEVSALEGAGETLRRLRAAGVRTALICDTGFTPGRVVRTLLEQVSLLPHLEHLGFSNEVGVPKPHPDMFHSALGALGVDATEAIHVGDLRRTDVAGARAVGMRTVRIADTNDDDHDAPDADAVVRSHAELRELLASWGVPLGEPDAGGSAST